MIGFRIDSEMYIIGEGDFLVSLVSTIYVKLENYDWGKKYPILMNDLYADGCIKKDKIGAAREELARLIEELKLLSPLDVIWNYEDLSVSIPDNYIKIVEKFGFTDLSQCFITDEDYDLLEVLQAALDTAEKRHADLSISVLHE